jgi:hypothetical protein
MAMHDYYDDLPLLARGKLPPARAAEILRAAESDAALRAAIDSERALEEVLALYEVPEPAGTLDGRFWRRFHGVDQAAGRGTWIFKLAGPLAAGVLITIGIIMFFRGDDPPVQPPEAGQTADIPDDAEIDWNDVVTYAADVAPEPRKLSDEDLALMKQLDNEKFLALDRIGQAEDLNLAEDLELLKALDRAEGK